MDSGVPNTKDVSVTSPVVTVKRRLSENLKRVRGSIEAACTRARRDPSTVRIVAVTKYVDMDVLRQAMELGLLDLGESRAQQLSQRAGMIHEHIDRKNTLSGRKDKPMPRPRWHMVGHVQRNKLKLILPWAELIHSVDSMRLAEDLHMQGERLGRVVDILLQVNTSGERSKFGVAVGAVPHLAEQFAAWPGIRLRGLMTMAPLDAQPGELRLFFERLSDVFTDMRDEGLVGPSFTELSMGMSSDYETAIECGATMVRLGHALFDGMMTAPTEDDSPESPA